ncbi:MAG: hypothetical protein GYB33_22100 [Gammaproteobacteria bacterium]|nr:hypothetical protein [Gammaproteobacteria bacterium]
MASRLRLTMGLFAAGFFTPGFAAALVFRRTFFFPSTFFLNGTLLFALAFAGSGGGLFYLYRVHHAVSLLYRWCSHTPSASLPLMLCKEYCIFTNVLW